MNLDRTIVIAGLPVKAVRDAVREMNRHDINNDGWSVDGLAEHMKISSSHAEWLCEALLERSVLERKPQPDTRWYERGQYYAVSGAGTRFINATMLKRITREKVDTLIIDLLERVRKINADDSFCYFVNEIRLFGSAVDAHAESFGDLDVCYLMARRKLPPGQKSWTDWNIARANLSGRHNMLYLNKLFYGRTEVLRMLKNRSPYISLHDLDDVVGIGADSIRLFIAEEGAIEVDGGGQSGESLSQEVMRAAVEKRKGREGPAQESSVNVALNLSTKERMVRAVKSLAFDVLRAVGESTPPAALEHSIEVACERIKAYRAEQQSERVEDILREALSIDAIAQKNGNEDSQFVFSGDLERRAQDGTNGKMAAEKAMKHAVIANLKCMLAGWPTPEGELGMTRQFVAYQHADYEQWKYRQTRRDKRLWDGPEYLSDRAVATIRRIANGPSDKLDKQALKILSDKGFIKLHRKTKWRLTPAGSEAIKYHDERDAWIARRTENKLAKLLGEQPNLSREQGLDMIRRGFA